MKRFARALAVTLALAVFGSIISLLPPKTATAVGGAPVTIMSPIPLPITDNVNATVSGNVSINGTPTVNANVSLPNPLPVQLVQQSAGRVART